MLRKGVFFAWSLIGLITFLFAACGGDASVPTATLALVQPTTAPAPTTTPIPTSTPAPTPTPTAAPSPTPAPTHTPTPIPSPTPPPVLTPSQVFALVSPSVAFIETPTTTGSAILIDGGYLLTNAHVVRGFDQIRVVFPDGSEFLEVPVKNSDDLYDLAILGPIETNLSALTLSDGEDLAIGSEVLLVGYPAESEEFPQPTITRGILSRFRQWEAIGMTYFQTDTALTGGQSGGALVSEFGEIIGISGLRFSDIGFGLVASAADLSPLADNLVSGNDVSPLGFRPLPTENGAREYEITVVNPWDSRRYTIDAPVGSTVELELAGLTDGGLFVIDPFGVPVLFADAGLTGVESGSVAIETKGPYVVIVAIASGSEGSFSLQGDADLVLFDDADNGKDLSVGDTVAGSLDTILDIDYFLLNLKKGQTVVVRVESLNFDAGLTIDFPGSREEQVTIDNDGGGGILGTDAEITYRAIQDGPHYLVVDSASGFDTGGYLLSVAEAPPDANPVIIPPSYETVDSPFGPMTIFVSANSGFSVQRPSEWLPVDLEQADLAFGVAEPSGNAFSVTSTVIPESEITENTLKEVADAFVSLFKSQLNGVELLSRERERERVETTQGLEAERVEWRLFDGLFRQIYLIILDESNRATTLILQAVGSEYEERSEMFEYIMESFMVEQQ